MAVQVTPNDVKQFLKFMVEFGGAYVVDDQSYVLDSKRNEKIPFTVDGTARFLTIYDPVQQNTDVCVFNPFVEGLEETDDKQFFYMTRSMVLSAMIFKIMKRIIELTIDVKSNKEATSYDVDLASKIAKFVSMDGIDNKLITELENITKNLTKFFNIVYTRKNNATYAVSGLTEDSFRDTFPASKIRKKSWDILMIIFREVLGIGEGVEVREEFKHLAQNNSCPRLDSFLRTYIHILKNMSQYIHLQNTVVDYNMLDTFLSNLGLYHGIARHYAGPIAKLSKPDNKVPSQQQTLPWQTSAPLPIPGVPLGTPLSANMVPMQQFAPIGVTPMMPVQQNPAISPMVQQQMPMPQAVLPTMMPMQNNMMPMMQQQSQVPGVPFMANTAGLMFPQQQQMPAMMPICSQPQMTQQPNMMQQPMMTQNTMTGIQMQSPVTVEDNLTRSPLL